MSSLFQLRASRLLFGPIEPKQRERMKVKMVMNSRHLCWKFSWNDRRPTIFGSCCSSAPVQTYCSVGLTDLLGCSQNGSCHLWDVVVVRGKKTTVYPVRKDTWEAIKGMHISASCHRSECVLSKEETTRETTVICIFLLALSTFRVSSQFRIGKKKIFVPPGLLSPTSWEKLEDSEPDFSHGPLCSP